MKRQRGFTLIEIMIVVVIIGIIGSIAFSAFQDAGQDTRRTRAIADISALNDAVARFYQTNFSYEGAVLADIADNAGIQLSDNYNFDLDVAADGQGYTLSARPIAGREQEGDGALATTQDGSRCYFPEDDDPADLSLCPHKF